MFTLARIATHTFYIMKPSYLLWFNNRMSYMILFAAELTVESVIEITA